MCWLVLPVACFVCVGRLGQSPVNWLLSWQAVASMDLSPITKISTGLPSLRPTWGHKYPPSRCVGPPKSPPPTGDVRRSPWSHGCGSQQRLPVHPNYKRAVTLQSVGRVPKDRRLGSGVRGVSCGVAMSEGRGRHVNETYITIPHTPPQCHKGYCILPRDGTCARMG